MKDWLDKLKSYDPVELIIGIDVLFFLLSFLFFSFGWFRFSWISLHHDFQNLGSQPWTIITYAFFHANFIALVFNMILLYYFGYISLEFINEKKFLAIFFSGIILGGLTFIWSYKLFPNLYINTGALLGASSGIMAVMTYISLKQPKYSLHIRFLGPVKLVHLLIFFILFNLLQIPLGNPGGYFAHLGGFITGLVIFALDKLQPDPIQSSPSENIEFGKNYRLNKILEKINRSGYESLTDDEKEFLFREGKD